MVRNDEEQVQMGSKLTVLINHKIAMGKEVKRTMKYFTELIQLKDFKRLTI